MERYAPGANEPSPLASAMERPVKLSELTFQEGVQNFGQIDVWDLWQNDPFIKSKMTNFSYFKCNLKIRIVPSCTPFQYGRIMWNYVPYSSDNEIFTNNYTHLRPASTIAGCEEAYFQYMSTYPITGYTDPSQNNVVELTAPFIYHKNLLPVNGTGSTARISLGKLVYGVLNTISLANPDASNTFKVAIFAEACDISLHVPTNLVPTSGRSNMKVVKKDETDEVEDGKISTIASSVAKAAGMLTTVPVIGPFAKATSIGAGGVSSIARLFGFSNPPSDISPQPRVLKLFRNLANTTCEDTAIKLSLDPKQETTIDPGVIGLESHDDMSFKAIYEREQWIAKGKWLGPSGQFLGAASSVILASRVNPTQSRTTDTLTISTINQKATQLSPAGYLQQCFKYWRGTIVYRIEVVCSKYHSGSLLIQFDPMVTSAALAVGDIHTDRVNTRQSAILDIRESTEIEIEIEYVNNNVFLEREEPYTNTMAPYHASQNAFNLHSFKNDEVDLGMITVSVLNELTAPGVVTDAPGVGAGVWVNMYFRCKDLSLAQPIDGYTEMRLRPTSGILSQNLLKSSDDSDMLTCFGESIESIRALVKRPNVASIRSPGSQLSNASQFVRYILPHYSPVLSFNSDTRNTYDSFFSGCFLAKRGGMRWKHYVWGTTAVNSGAPPNRPATGILSVSRDAETAATLGASTTVQNTSSWSRLYLLDNLPLGALGMEVTDNGYRPTVDVELPFYSAQRFWLACAINNTLRDGSGNITELVRNPTAEQILFQNVCFQGMCANSWALMSMCSAAEDYNLMMFQAPATIWREV